MLDGIAIQAETWIIITCIIANSQPLLALVNMAKQ
jgi:hypothetical protein